MTYAEYEAGIVQTALQKPYGQSFLRGLGIVKDWVVGQTKTGVQYRFPDFAVPDALGAIGDERSIGQGIDTLTGANESSTDYADRLKNAWAADDAFGAQPDTDDSIWYWGGTGFGMLRAFAALGYGQDVTIIQQNGVYYSLDGSDNLVIANHAALSGWPYWNSFLVLFSTTPASWTAPAQVCTSSTVPSLNEINRLIQLIRIWRPAQMLCLGIQLTVSGRVWGLPPSGSSGAPVWGTGTWGGSVIRWGDPPTQAYPPAPF